MDEGGEETATGSSLRDDFELYIPGELGVQAISLENEVTLSVSKHNPGAEEMAEELRDFLAPNLKVEVEGGVDVDEMPTISRRAKSQSGIEKPAIQLKRQGTLSGDLLRGASRSAKKSAKGPFLLHLNKETFVGEEGDALAETVRRARAERRTIVMTHGARL